MFFVGIKYREKEERDEKVNGHKLESDGWLL